MNEPVQRQQIGYDLAGNPMYAGQVFSSEHLLPAQQPPLQPIQARPWGAYLAGGCLALVALVVVAFVLVAILIGLSIALVVLAIALVALVVCLLILRDVWRSTRKG
ncbi:hypothetical protein [Streptomyces apocyni]|uniref:hypothetical protein n=1 Tax=Streptomyces apocyni TaxID=2654677 RepID=UPI0012EA1A3F|nr:hypothetical protein [Streptomyces apocyni]